MGVTEVSAHTTPSNIPCIEPTEVRYTTNPISFRHDCILLTGRICPREAQVLFKPCHRNTLHTGTPPDY